MSQKLNTPKGTRDFSSLELKKREYLLNVLKDCFKSFNFHGFKLFGKLLDFMRHRKDSLYFRRFVITSCLACKGAGGRRRSY